MTYRISLVGALILTLSLGCSREQVQLSDSTTESGSGGSTTGAGGSQGTQSGTGTGGQQTTGAGGQGQGGQQTTGVGGQGQGGQQTTASGGQGQGGQLQAGTIEIAPQNASIALTNGQPQASSYSVTFKDKNGNPQDVTAQAKLWLDDDIGTFNGSTLTAEAPGTTVVHAQYQGLKANTGLTITMGNVVIEPGAPGGAPNDFKGPKSPNGGATIVYPDNALLVPPNMTVLEVHYHPGGNDSLFELELTSPKIDLKVYFPCTSVGGGCAYAMSKAVWHAVSDAARGGAPVTYVLRGVDGQNPGSVSESAPRTISFGEENIHGGVYYWNANPGMTMRYEFGKSGQSAETYLDAAQAGAQTCVGCHVVSRNGSRIAVGLNIPGPAEYKVYDVGTKKLYYDQGSPFGGGGANFFSFTPDGKRLLASNGINTTFRDADTGNAIGADPLFKNSSMPDFSPDGKHVVYVKAQSAPPCIPGFACGATGSDKGSLIQVDFDGQSFTNEKTLVGYAGQNNYYPAYSPDGAWVLFNRSPSDVSSYDAPDAEVWVVASAGGAPIKLGKSFAGGDSWPKWTSSTQNYQGKTLMWLTFSSRRAYGLRLANGERAQIWMTAFDPSLAAAGKDPSYPAFWMPFQDVKSGNHIAQWVEKVERKPCQQDSDCGGAEACLGGICLPHQ